jgi:hypothetical protein
VLLNIIRITLDNNCLLSLNKRDGEYEHIKSLLTLNSEQITLCIPAIVASENQQNEVVSSNFGQFQEFLARIGCQDCELLNPMLYLDICYWDHAVLAGEEMALLEQRVHEILFPKVPFKYSEYCATFGLEPNNGIIDRKWRNAKCDVQAMWCHIEYKGDIFVSQDNNFHKKTKKSKLIALGAKNIMTPSECLSELTK